MVKIGDKFKFIPTAWERPNNGSEAARLRRQTEWVMGTVVQIHEKHRWYRVEYELKYAGKQSECFKF